MGLPAFSQFSRAPSAEDREMVRTQAILGVLFAGSIFFTTAKFEPTKPEPMNWFVISGGYAAVGIMVAAIIVQRSGARAMA